MKINILLFDDFETLDVFGPVEILAKIEGAELCYCSLEGGVIKSAQGTEIITSRFENVEPDSVLAVPGGRGTRSLVNEEDFLRHLLKAAEASKYVLSICTGSALLAKAGILDGKKATSNKKAFDWVTSLSGKVEWIRHARWVRDGKFYTSSGVSAGMDMALGFVRDLYGQDVAEQAAQDIEYIWNADSDRDPFCKE